MGKKVIISITNEQEAQFQRFVDKWVAISQNCERSNRPRAEAAIKRLYGLAKLSEPQIVWLNCPMSGLIGAIAYAAGVVAPKEKAESAVATAVTSGLNLIESVIPQMKVGEQVAITLERLLPAIWSAAKQGVKPSNPDALVQTGREREAGPIAPTLRHVLGSSETDTVRQAGLAFFGGSFWSGYAAWADFFNEVCDLDIDRSFLDLVESTGYYWTLDGLCIMTERPTEIHLIDNRLHNETGKAIGYLTDWGIYALNGVIVPEYLVMQHPDEVDVRRLIQERNVEIRREGIRKLGQERIVARLGAKILDKKRGDQVYSNQEIETQYELLSVNMNFGEPWRYLKMLNPSVPGVWHIEPVPRDIESVQQAINYRVSGDKEKRWDPRQLT